MKPKRFTRPCKRCNETFTPTGRENWICEKCNKMNQRRKTNNKTNNKTNDKLKEKQYFKQKILLDAIRDDVTLKRWKVLSKAYKLGKSIWGNKFTVVRLAEDMGTPYSTVQRCLSLNKANKRTWALIKAKKISVFRVALILQTKCITYQDKIIDLVIEDNLSTYQIKTLKIDQIEDVNVERHRLAIENGYSRERSAYYSFNNWIDRGKIFLLMDIDKLPKDKVPVIKEELEKLNKGIKLYLGKD